MRLVDDWKDFWKWNSTWVAVIAAALPTALPAAWAQMPPDLKAQIPDNWMTIISVVMLFAFVIARVRAQK